MPIDLIPSPCWYGSPSVILVLNVMLYIPDVTFHVMNVQEAINRREKNSTPIVKEAAVKQWINKCKRHIPGEMSRFT